MLNNNTLTSYILRSLICENHLTRNDLTRRVGIRPATIFDTIRALCVAGLVAEPERKGAKTGRRASPIRLNSDYGYYLGIALDPMRAQFILIDNAGAPIAEIERAFDQPVNRERAHWEIDAGIEALYAGAPSGARERTLAVGFSDPGVVDIERGVSIKAVNVPGWENIDMRRRLVEALDRPAWVFPEMIAHAYAERLIEGPVSPNGSFHLSLDSGIAGAYMRELDPFIGDSFCQMEIGHMIVEENGPLCQCGNRGCLEAVAGAAGIRRRLAELARHEAHSILTEQEFSFEHLIHCAKQKDKAALWLVVEIANSLGATLASVVTLLNPSLITLSGPLFELEDILLPAIRQVLTLRCMSLALDKMELRVSRLPPNARALGVALLVREKHLVQWAETATA